MGRAEALKASRNKGSGMVMFDKIDRDKLGDLPTGKSYWRVLAWDLKDLVPPVVTIAKHFGINGEIVPCFDGLTGLEGANRVCPVCKLIRKKKLAMTKEQWKDWSSDIRQRTQYGVWMIDLEAPSKKPRIFEIPFGVGDAMLKAAEDEEWGPWWKPGSQYDFRVIKTGKGLKTRYETTSTRRFADIKTPKSHYELIENLEKIYTVSNTQEWWLEQITKLLEGVDGDVDDEDSENLEDDEDEAPRSRGRDDEDDEAEDEDEAPKAAKKAKGKAAVEDEEEEDGDIEDTGEDEEEEQPKSKKSKAKDEDEEEEELEADEDEEEEPKAKGKSKAKDEDEEEEEFEDEEEEEEPKAKKGKPAAKADEEEEELEDDEEDEKPAKAAAGKKTAPKAKDEDEEEFDDDDEDAPPPKKTSNADKLRGKLANNGKRVH